jgi:hypothetical protein
MVSKSLLVGSVMGLYYCSSQTLDRMPAVCREQLKHCEYVEPEDVGMINKLIGFFKNTCGGNGRLLLNILGGKIHEFEPTSRIAKTPKKKSA